MASCMVSSVIDSLSFKVIHVSKNTVQLEVECRGGLSGYIVMDYKTGSGEMRRHDGLFHAFTIHGLSVNTGCEFSLTAVVTGTSE
jgi:hypothetical protein